MKKYTIIVLSTILLVLWYCIYQKTFNLEIVTFEVPKKIYLALDEEKEIEVKVTEKENKKVNLKYISENERILITDKNKIKGIKDGKTKLIIKAQNGDKKEIEVIVTSLITKPKINNEKEYIKCNEYTKEEAELLEEILEYRINEAGYKTRGGALSAARFLLLEFKSGIKYFNENGRLESHSNIEKIDGEGRFYHKGLYLTEEKYKEINPSSENGPKMWGCPLVSTYYGKEEENGLNCSGFITWALFNAGYDIGDVGAGNYEYIHNELLDLKPKEKITEEFLKENRIKPGDLIGFDGHIAMIIGIETNKIYVGESYETGLRVRTFTNKELAESEFTDLILMDSYYNEEGKYTNMW